MKHIFQKFCGALTIFVLLFALGGMRVEAAGDVIKVKAKEVNDLVVQIDGESTGEAQVGDLHFVVGRFSKAQIENGDAQDRNNVIILNTKTRQFSPWQIDTDGEVFDIEVVNNMLFLGGAYETVDGKIQNNLAVFDIPSQRILSVVTGTNASVRGLEAYENTVYVGGDFTQFVDSDLTYIGAFDTVSRSITSWKPRLDGVIRDMKVVGDRLYIVGEFTSVNGVERLYAASFLLPEGELTEWKVNSLVPFDRIEVAGDMIMLVTSDEKQVSSALDSTVVDPKAQSSIFLTEEEKALKGLSINVESLGFKIPTLGDLLTFAIRAFFVIAGLAALFYLLRGALSWVTSGGDKDSVTAAREKIQAAVIGMILIVAVLSIVWTLEQVIFNRKICLGLSCPLTLPALLESNTQE